MGNGHRDRRRRGLGRAYGIALGKAGAAVAVGDISGRTAERTASAVRQTGARAMSLECDVTQAAAFEDIFARAESELVR